MQNPPSNSLNSPADSGFHRWIYWVIVIALSIIGGAFYYFQNYGGGIGGGIALPKLFWLAYALWFWYFLPLLIATDRRISSQIRKVYWLFWANMVFRAVAEVWMMYISQNWHPYWGIGHDIFSAVLVLGLLLQNKNNIQEQTVEKSDLESDLDKVVRFNLKIMGAMFLIESYFAWYMLTHVKSDSGPVYFVPGNSQYIEVMVLTWIVVIGLTIQQIIFARKWL